MRFFELAQKLKISHEALFQKLREQIDIDLAGGDTSIDPLMTLSDADVAKIRAAFAGHEKTEPHSPRVSTIGISNFKAFGPDEQRIPLKPLTFIFGPNSAGKSSLLHSLLWAEDAFHTGKLDVIRPRLSGDMVDLGGIRNVVYRKGVDGNTFNLRYTFAPEEQSEALVAGIGEAHTLHLELTVHAGSITDEAQFQTALNNFFIEGEPAEGHLSSKPSITRFALFLNDSESPLLRLSRRKSGGFAVNNFDVSDPSFKQQWLIATQGFTFSKESTAMEKEAMRAFLDAAVKEIVAEADRALPVRARFIGAPPWIEEALSGLFDELDIERQAHSEATHHEAGEVAESYADHYGDDEYEPEQQAGDYALQADPEPDYQMPSDAEIGRYNFDERKMQEIANAVRFYAESTIESLVRETSSMLLNYLDSLIYLGSQRAYPDRGFTFTTKRDANWHANGGDAWDRLSTDPQLREKVNAWLQDENHLKAPYKVEMRKFVDIANANKQIYDAVIEAYDYSITGEVDFSEYSANSPGNEDNSRIELLRWDNDDVVDDVIGRVLRSRNIESHTELLLVDVRSDTIVSHRDVGVGVSQIIPILATAMSLEGKTVAIEEPESHLHPRAQAELADVFIESALTGKNPNTFIVETHSETLLLRILRRIRESSFNKNGDRAKITPEDVAFIYIDPIKGGAKALDVRIDERGRVLDSLPDGFFEEDFDELFGG